MNFTHSQERQMLADTLDRYLADHYGIEARNRISGSDAGWSAAIWKQLVDLGVVGMLFGEEAGGYGGDAFDIAVIFEQIGRHLVVEPLLGTLIAGRALERAKGFEGVLAEAIGGGTHLAAAIDEEDLYPDPQSAGVRAEGGKLTGAKRVVPQLAAAQHIVLPASDGEEVALYLVDAAASGVAVRDYPLIDGGRGGDLTLAAAPATRIGGAELIRDVAAAGVLALCWEAVGIMDRLKEATLDYLRVRKQFGVAIGSFQALRHRIATVALEIEQARSAAINAAAALAAPAAERDRAIAAAKFTIGRVGTLVAEEAIQMHGGIGMTWELPVSHYAKRLTMIDHQLGSADFHIGRVATARAA
ncbi:pimeloyl-CoA dehydrogenase small subunit [Sphingobium sp. 22B]|uniref:acyl-CoA dehydrogenase family protein n=1 Tax=unclassified Sphingobium TaxID=2611147 RepID=UPI0007820D09|nr:MULTISPECIES: acyl-CoA dehydrogenase family protein [unclassified Sphingobium]KXU32698.1 pimeloyl-CoA dehydrogenase small subunit [Sphingobium sp. AM]KYC32776.1 pimeloyl-CoA dehydrogenase small subunit [Sphingobium sp. 22B]OAP31666.1 pimeloyl-CoA dehydrogenase small subunit [Sphingobium sp. 20006FA]